MEQMLSAPNRVRLALAVLIEYGAVQISENHAETETPRGFAQFFGELAGGIGPGNLHLYALIDEGGKKHLPSMLASVSLNLGEKELARLEQGTGLLQLPFGDSEVFLLFETVDPRSYPHQHKQFSFSGCLFLLEQRIPRPKLYKLIADFRALLGKMSHLYVYSGNEQVRKDLSEVAPDLVLGIEP